MPNKTYDFVIIGSGFGGSVSAMRLTEKGYSVLVLERGKRFNDEDFPKTNWNIFKYLWAPPLRCFGILQISPFRDFWVLHGSGVGGGSLGYANVLMQPPWETFEKPAWKRLADWGALLEPHFETAKRMLGVTKNPRLWFADDLMREIAQDLGKESTFQATEVGVFFGEPGQDGQECPDPYFGGEGLSRRACIQCGGCMVGCRYNAKNTLVKNYLYFAEKWGAQVLPEAEVHDVRPLPPGQADQARYEVAYHRSTAWLGGSLFNPEWSIRARNVVFSAGALGTQRLLFRCRDTTRSLPHLSQRLGDLVRNNSEALMGSTSWDGVDYSEGIAITSLFNADPVTTIEPVRYPAGSSFIRLLSGPLLSPGGSLVSRLGRTLLQILSHPLDFFRSYLKPGWAQHTTIMLVMQTEDNKIRLRPGRSFFTLFRKGLVSKPYNGQGLPSRIEIGYHVTKEFARKTDGIPAASINESLFDTPITAHILGGCPMGADDQEGVIDLECRVHNYPGLYVVDGSILPANPGINPSLTITAMAEYAMSRVPPKQREKETLSAGEQAI